MSKKKDKENNYTYKLTSKCKKYYGIKLYQIKALRDFAEIKKGELGGWIESTNNLSQEEDCWVGGNAYVMNNAFVCGKARVYDNALVVDSSWVDDNARVYGFAQISGSVGIRGNVEVSEYTQVQGEVELGGRVKVAGNAIITGCAEINEDVTITHSHQYLNIPNLKHNLTITANSVRGGCRLFTHEEFRKLTLKQCEDETWSKKELDGYKLALRIWESMQ